MSSPGSKRPSTRPRGGGIRGAPPDAALDVLAAVTAQAREEHKNPQLQAPPDMQSGQSIRACLRRGVPADHEAHSRSCDSCEESQRLSFGGTAAQRPKQVKARPWQRPTIAPTRRGSEQTRAGAATWNDLRHKSRRGRKDHCKRSRETEQSKARRKAQRADIQGASLKEATLLGSTLCRPKIQHPKIGRNRIGRSRNWPKSKLAQVEIDRSRN